MLDLRPDTRARVGEGRRLSFGVAVQRPDARVVVLRGEHDAAVLEKARLVEALRKGDVAAHALGLALFKEELRQLLQRARRELRLRVLGSGEQRHLLRARLGLAHDLRLARLRGGRAAVQLRELRGDLLLELRPMRQDVQRAVLPRALHDGVRVAHPVVVRVQLVHAQAVLLQQQCRQQHTVLLCLEVFLAARAVHDDLDGERRLVAARGLPAIARVPAHLVLSQVLPCVDVVDVVVDAGVVHVGVWPRRTGVLLGVLLHVLQVVGVVDGHALDLARAAREQTVGLVLCALLVRAGVLGPNRAPRDDLLVDDEAMLRPRRVWCQFCHDVNPPINS